MKLTLLLCAVLALGGCAKPPKIEGYHWKASLVCYGLYDSNGKQAADVFPAFLGGHAQGCVFNIEPGCDFFETTDEAFAYVQKKELRK